MFDHLDDPNPPQPTALVTERVMAEGARRIRQRRIVGSGAAAFVALLGAVGVLQVLPGGDGADVDVVGDRTEDTTTSSTATTPTTAATGGTTGTTTTTAGVPGRSGPTTPGPDEGQDVFAGIVYDAGEGVARVVLADARFGDVDRVLAEYQVDEAPLGAAVAWSLAGDHVYYSLPAGTYDGSSAGDTIWRVATDEPSPEPQRVVEGGSAGSNLALSPSGAQLAYTRFPAGDPEELVVRDLSSGGEQVLPFADPMLTVIGTAFVDETTVVVSIMDDEALTRLYAFDLDGADSLAGGRLLGPGQGAPPGTGWNVTGRREIDGSLGVVEVCCSFEATSDATYLAVDPATGAVRERVPVPEGRLTDAETNPSGDIQLFLVPPPVRGATTTTLRRMDGAITGIFTDAEVVAFDW